MTKLVIKGSQWEIGRIGNEAMSSVRIEGRRITSVTLRSNLLDVETRPSWENSDTICREREYRVGYNAGGKYVELSWGHATLMCLWEIYMELPNFWAFSFKSRGEV